jgi:hypothetical protein
MRGLVILTVLLLGAAGCTKGEQDNGIASAGGARAATTATPTEGARYDPINWVRCLREHGITVDDPDPSDPGGGKPNIHASTREQIDAAAEQCRGYNPNWGKPNPPPDPADLERQRTFAQCMREHGIDWDDPDANYQTPAEPPPPGSELEPGKPTPSGPQFDQATRECAEQVPGIVDVPDDGTEKERLPGTGISVESPDGPKGSDPTQ